MGSDTIVGMDYTGDVAWVTVWVVAGVVAGAVTWVVAWVVAGGVAWVVAWVAFLDNKSSSFGRHG